MQSLLYGLIWFFIGGILLYIVIRKDKHHVSILYKLILRRRFKKQLHSRRHIYKSGPFSRIPNGKFRLPGIAANIALLSLRDQKNEPMGVLVHGKSHFTIILRTEPEGMQLMDAHQIDANVDRYGLFLNSLSDEPGLVQASVSIESEPENGARLRDEISSRMQHPSAANFARDTMREIAETYPENSYNVSGYIGLTYSIEQSSTTKNPLDKVVEGVVKRLPILMNSLEASGAGSCKILDANEIYAYVRTAFDPDVKKSFDELEPQQKKSDWLNVGPSFAIAKPDYYVTDSGVHKSYIMSNAPSGEVLSNVLNILLQPDKTFAKKRVTLIYRPLQYEDSAVRVQSDLVNAQFKANSSNRPTARQIMAVQQAEQTAAEEARGAHLINFSAVVTITLSSEETANTANAVLMNLSAASRISLRNAVYTQESAFLSGLALGIPIEKFYSSFDMIKDMV
jgi:hypothetical protein